MKSTPGFRPLISKLLMFVVLIAVGGVGYYFSQQKTGRSHASDASPRQSTQPSTVGLVQLTSHNTETVRLASADAMKMLGIRVGPVHGVAPPEALRLPGVLSLDPSRIVRVHCRFLGEVISIGIVADGSRPLRYGDTVKKGQVLAVIWSKEVGEKKSELVDAISKLDADTSTLARMDEAGQGVLTARAIYDARRAVEADLIAVARAERTLRSWRISEDEIESVRQEVKLIQKRTQSHDKAAEQKWAETVVRTAIDGIVAEKNVNPGDIIDQDDDLFKIADLRQLQVVANVYEEDIAALRELPQDQRRWMVDLKSDPNDEPVEGTFDLIGSVIDPAQRTGVLMGWIENHENRFAIGQFITATVHLLPDKNLVSVPESALIEEGDLSAVFVEVDREHLEFARRKVSVARRCRGSVLVRTDQISPTDRVIVSGVLQLGAELNNLRRLAAAIK